MNLEQKLSKKLKKTGGFTLIEMLIVVAIIAILVAVSIPLVSGALEKARKATDAANERAAKAAALIEYMANGTTATEADPLKYDVTTGAFTDAPKGYGQCADHKNGYITVAVGDDGNVILKWAGGETSGHESDLDSTELMTGNDTGSVSSSEGDT